MIPLSVVSSRSIVVGVEILSKLWGDEGFVVVVPSVIHNITCDILTSPTIVNISEIISHFNASLTTKKKVVRIMSNINYLFSCMVLAELWFTSMMAPWMVMVMSAACIFIVSRINKFCFEWPNFLNNVTPIRQLWYPASAIEDTLRIHE